MSTQRYTEDYKREKIDELRKARLQRENDLMTQMNNKYTRSEMSLFAQWEALDRRGMPIHKEYDKSCIVCNNEFITNRYLQNICDSCKAKAQSNKYSKKTAICSYCVNYWACGKFTDTLKVQRRMLDYGYKKYYNSNTRRYEDILNVYNCEGFLGKNELTKKQLETRRKSFITGKQILFTKQRRVNND